MKFTWDENKNTINKTKHCISFEEAINVFYDDAAIVIEDNSEHYDEQRMRIIGLSTNRILFVVYTEVIANKIHIISARRAEKNEVRLYSAK
jgi:uncharacterized DUF497 family protein